VAKTSGIPGLAVAMATAGLFLVYVGVRDVPFMTGLREIVRGRTPTARPRQTITIPDELRFSQFDRADDGSLFGDGSGGGSASGHARIAEAARRYLGTPYKLGGHAPGGFDCSGLVTWVLVKDIGLTTLPNPVHTVTAQFMVWNSGSQVVPRDQAAAGDLVCWLNHMGIAISRDEMIHAPQPGEVVKISRIWGLPNPPIIRRVRLPTPQGGGGMQTR
jgi:cell wall-associated NlpC family hydrolase